MRHEKFEGTGVALVTPFRNNEIDFPALEKLIEHVIKGQVEFLVPLGSTGESATLNEEEQRTVLDFVIEKNKGRKAILAGNFGGKNTQELCKKIKSYNFDGIDGILSSSPEYSKPNQEGIYRHYMALADASPVPIMIYNVPGRTKSNIEWSTTIRLAEASTNFIGIKEASGDLIQATRIIKNRPKGFIVTSGDDEVALPMIACGGEGVISVIANAFPLEFSTMIRLAREENFVQARLWNYKTYDLHKWLYIEGNPVGIKSALEQLDICTNEVRLPLCNMNEENYNKLAGLVQKMVQE
jgi:4-hydroxy-tetrahydrodipicolinate synthase